MQEKCLKLQQQIVSLQKEITKLKAKHGSSEILKKEALSLVSTLQYIQEDFYIKLNQIQQQYGTLLKLSDKISLKP